MVSTDSCSLHPVLSWKDTSGLLSSPHILPFVLLGTHDTSRSGLFAPSCLESFASLPRVLSHSNSLNSGEREGWLRRNEGWKHSTAYDDGPRSLSLLYENRGPTPQRVMRVGMDVRSKILHRVFLRQRYTTTVSSDSVSICRGKLNITSGLCRILRVTLCCAC